MKIISDPLELKKYLHDQVKSAHKTIGFVPTMGALHEGHISLMKQARKENDCLVVSIFVNPTQFLKGEDLDSYPKKTQADQKICQVSGVDVLFFPHVNSMYSDDEVNVLAPKVRGFVLEGYSRPGHFNGVLTVVMKLLNIVEPVNAYFGKKDAQQLHLIQLMVKQLFMNVNIVPVDTVREKDGLALSSRNIYLDKAQRADALKISSSLRLATKLIGQNILDAGYIIEKMLEELHPLEIVYVEILDRDFNKVANIEVGGSIILVEVKIGSTRLLDNVWI